MVVIQSIAKCSLEYLYNAASFLLKKLRSFIEKIIVIIDAQILALRALLAEHDYVKKISEYVWNKVENKINEIKNMLLSGLPGPADNLCPEFYQYLIDPAIGLMDASLAAFTPYKDKWLRDVSIVDKLDRAIAYWESRN